MRIHCHPHALWCPGQNHRTRVKRSTPAEKLDQSRNIKEHVRCIRTLTSLAIDSGFDAKRVRIHNLISGDDRGSKGRKRIKALSTTKLAAAPALLPVSGAYVVSSGVAKNVIECAWSRNILAFPAKNDCQLTFIIYLVALQSGGQHNRITRILQSIRTLHK